jgi:hypothetical protein
MVVDKSSVFNSLSSSAHTDWATIIKTDRHHITEILLKVALNTIKSIKKQTGKQIQIFFFVSLSHNVVLLALSGTRIHNTSGDRHRFHR